jgi:cytochrome c
MQFTPKLLVIAFFALIMGAAMWGILTQRRSIFDWSQASNGPRSSLSGKLSHEAFGDPPASFAACAECHSMTPVDSGNPIQPASGPSLSGIYGARSGGLDFKYSPALVKAFPIWDTTLLNRFIANPQAVIPGTTMSFKGEPDPAKRATIIAYLKLNSSTADAK